MPMEPSLFLKQEHLKKLSSFCSVIINMLNISKRFQKALAKDPNKTNPQWNQHDKN